MYMNMNQSFLSRKSIENQPYDRGLKFRTYQGGFRTITRRKWLFQHAGVLRQSSKHGPVNMMRGDTAPIDPIQKSVDTLLIVIVTK